MQPRFTRYLYENVAYASGSHKPSFYSTEESQIQLYCSSKGMKETEHFSDLSFKALSCQLKSMSRGSVWIRPNLFWRSSRCGVSDRPSSLFPGPELCLLQNINQHWEDVGINYCLLSGIRRNQRQGLRQQHMGKNGDSKADWSWSLLVPVQLQAWCESITCICALFPAVMLEMVQHASFLIDSLALLRRCSKQGRAEQFNTTWNTHINPLVIILYDKCKV